MKALVLIEDHFEDAEGVYPYYRLLEAGFKVDVAGPEKREYESKHGYPLKATITAKNVKVDEYKAVIIPGGLAPDHMRQNKDMVRIVKEAVNKGKTVGAICHGAQMLIEADVLKGKNATCYNAISTDLKNAGAQYSDKEVVVDKNLVTSRFPADLPAFMREIIKLTK